MLSNPLWPIIIKFLFIFMHIVYLIEAEIFLFVTFKKILYLNDEKSTTDITVLYTW